jgi:hypothetical protein
MFEYRKRVLSIILALVFISYFLPVDLNSKYFPAGSYIFMIIIVSFSEAPSCGSQISVFFRHQYCLYSIYAC